jgi:HSP20 family protein
MYFDILDDMLRLRNRLNKGYYRNGYAQFPPINVYDKGDDVILEAVIPGVKKEDINLNFENNVLSIDVDKKSREDENIKYIRRERDFGEFNKSLKFGIPIDHEHMEANYKDGILKIVFKKEEKAKPKKIKIS